MAMTQTEQKELVAATAIDTLIKNKKIFSGMKIGLGTGSTAVPAVKHLAKRIADGTLKDIKAVVTSFGTQNLCEELEIPVYSMNDKIIGGHLDLAIDGADEVDPDNNVIKGGGAALLREKIVAYNSDQFVIVADSTKVVDSVGRRDEQRVGRTERGAAVPIDFGIGEGHEAGAEVFTDLFDLPCDTHGVGLVAVGGGLVSQIVCLAHDALQFFQIVWHNFFWFLVF